MDNNSSKTKSKSSLAEWLEKLQQESWQLELLISGLALYGVYASAELVEDFNTFAELNGNTSILATIFAFAYGLLFLGWRIFFFNLLIHVILRGLWIASIGLRYVSDAIDFDELDYASEYTSYLKEKIGTYDEFIERLEKLCSVIFAFTFLIFLLFLSLGIFTFVLISPLLYQVSYHGWQIIIPLIAIVYFVLGLIVAIDFITLGSIKKIREPWVVKFYSPIFKFYSYLTLSFMYRPILYNFLDQKYTKKFLVLAVPYVVLLGGVDSSFTNRVNPYLDTKENLMKTGLLIEDALYADLLEDRIKGMTSYDRKKYLNKNLGDIFLSNYHIKDGKLSFFKRDDQFGEMMYRKFNKESIFKKGVLFNLFFDHENENSDIRQIEERYLEQYVTIHKSYSESRSELKIIYSQEKVDSLLSIQRDSIDRIIDSLELKKRNEVKSYRENYNQEIFDHAVSMVQVKIDSIDYTDSLSCKYFKDQFLGGDGILCNLYESTLPKGNKIIEFTNYHYNEFAVDSIRIITVKIPVYIE